MPTRPVAVSTGCPSGVGPEVSLVAAVRAAKRKTPCVLVGDVGALHRAARATDLDGMLASIPVWRGLSDIDSLWNPSSQSQPSIAIFSPTDPLTPSDIVLGHPSEAAGRAQLGWVDAAVDLVQSGFASALATAPISKQAIAKSDAFGALGFIGHTQHIARRCGVDHPVMAFVIEKQAVALVTNHVALARVPEELTADGIARTTLRCAELLVLLGVASPRLAVCALNPHGGESGMFGEEDSQIIVPGIELARQALARTTPSATVHGPLGSEVAFRQGFDGRYDGIVAMYHDQATTPLKLLRFGEAVNVTVGLPIVRTSADHGTAYDIAGTGRADPSSMDKAIALAATFVAAGTHGPGDA